MRSSDWSSDVCSSDLLDPANHRPGTPIDMISYHFYAGAHPGLEFGDYHYAYFDKADAFLNCVRYIERIRQRLAPETGTAINELGTFQIGRASCRERVCKYV